MSEHNETQEERMEAWLATRDKLAELLEAEAHCLIDEARELEEHAAEKRKSASKLLERLAQLAEADETLAWP